MLRPRTLALGFASWIALPARARQRAYSSGLPFQNPPLGSFQICQHSTLPAKRFAQAAAKAA